GSCDRSRLGKGGRIEAASIVIVSRRPNHENSLPKRSVECLLLNNALLVASGTDVDYPDRRISRIGEGIFDAFRQVPAGALTERVQDLHSEDATGGRDAPAEFMVRPPRRSNACYFGPMAMVIH